jgi:uncharacterized protein (DUF608 family)
MNRITFKSLQMLAFSAALVFVSFSLGAREYNQPYSGKQLDHIAFPIGGIGTGMFCVEGTGAISNMSMHHYPELFNEPCTFAAIYVKGTDGEVKGEGVARVLEGNVPDYKKFGRNEGGMGVGGTTWGLPRFDEATFSARFPFAKIDLQDSDLPVKVQLVAWNPFIPDDEDNSGLPVAGMEYTFTNTSGHDVSAIFSFNTRNFMYRTGDAPSPILKMDKGFVLTQLPTQNAPEVQGSFAVYTDESSAVVNYNWFRGGWFDPLTMAWNKVATGDMSTSEPQPGGTGASIYVPFTLKAGESKTILLKMAWYVPYSIHRIGPDATTASDFGSCYSPDMYKDNPQRYEPWYSHRFANVGEVVSYWTEKYDSLKAETKKFSDAFYDTTLPSEVVEAVADNLTILKSTTTMRQSDGKFWVWEGSGDSWGSCHGSCTHVWNYAQAVPNLFPRLERSLRQTEFTTDQNTEGHQIFRANLPIRPAHHDFHAAADGQLGGIIKVYRDWRISGDTQWIKSLYPQIKQSMDYCIRTWDPDEEGAVIEPHHNTYDIEFWGPGGMCSSFYGSALNSIINIGRYIGEDVSRYEAILKKNRKYMSEKLYNGEYFYQTVRWKDLKAQDPTKSDSFQRAYTPEERAIIEKEGPKYQYGTGCLSDGMLGYWMSMVAGLDEPMDHDMVRSHLNAVYRYNLKHDLSSHANPQRPGYAMGKEGGLLLCSWPNGGKPSLPFVYSDEVWTGIEFQVAAHLMFEGEVDKGLDIVRTCLDRYDGAVRNPFNEYECGSWYARAMSSYSMLQALTGARYDAVDKVLYIDSRIGDSFRSFLSTASGYGTVGLEKGKPFLKVISGTIDVRKCIVDGKVKSLK